MMQFQTPQESLGNLDTEVTATLIATASDIALVLDREGVILDLAFGSDDLSREGYGKWLGKPWADTVTIESRPKIEALLKDVDAKTVSRGRQVNHTSLRGADLPVLYSTLQLSHNDRVVAIGRDLRAVALLQQRLVDIQQSMERDYSRLRHMEMRYRLLFQLSSEAVLIIDAATYKIAEANPASSHMLGETSRQLQGHALLSSFTAESQQTVQALLARVRATGRIEEANIRMAHNQQDFLVSVSLFRQENTSFFLVRLSPLQSGIAVPAIPESKSRLLALVESAPDGFVVTDPDGRILTANSSFLDLAELATEEQAHGELLERWLGRTSVDLSVLIANLREHGAVRLFATTIRGEYGSIADVEISAVAVLNGEPPCLGFTIRNVGRRLTLDASANRETLRPIEQLTELVGRVPLKDLVRESTDMIERMCIEAALELTGDNRASAAEMLGLSRQSLYVKLRRYGLADAAAEGGGDSRSSK
jgi:transcriptional regulator PpsR